MAVSTGKWLAAVVIDDPLFFPFLFLFLLLQYTMTLKKINSFFDKILLFLQKIIADTQFFLACKSWMKRHKSGRIIGTEDDKITGKQI